MALMVDRSYPFKSTHIYLAILTMQIHRLAVVGGGNGNSITEIADQE